MRKTAPGSTRSKSATLSKSRRSPPFAVIGIGASAGGFRVLRQLLGDFTSNFDGAVIVAQHLDDGGKQLAIESLQSVSQLKVISLKKGTVIEGGRVYVVPPHSIVSFDDHKVQISEAKRTPERLTVIDHLFKAIGGEFKARAAGVILSGESSDGAQGIRSINEHGGLTLAQSPDSAEHRSMPEAAIATAALDHVLSPRDLSSELNAFAEFISQNINSDGAAFKDQVVSAITSICDRLFEKTKHDFKHYKTSTLVRRIQRRMQVLQLTKVEDYLDHLKQTEDECDTLFRELLINVTSFFRDRDAFEALRENVLSPLVEKKKSNQKIRIWCAGCSTGEEPYTIAILLRELLEKIENPPEVQIIATDIDDAALNSARKGVFSATIAEHLSPQRLAKNFVKRGGKYHVVKELREMCLFSIHNLITDPPFSQLDLITCRNVLIYLGPHLQKKLFPVFHYALKPGGYLFLGTSETLTAHRELFKAVDSKHRIAQRKMTAIKLPSLNTSVQSYLSNFQGAEKSEPADLNLIGQRIALDEMPLKYAVVNDEMQILSSSGGLAKYVHIPEGEFHNNIVKLVSPSLRPALRAAFVEAKKVKRKITNDSCTLKTDAGLEKTEIIVQPMPQLGDFSELYWVAFHATGLVQSKDVSAPTRAATDTDVELIDQLERELSMTRQELDKSVQDLEASNEELKSSNEELLSMNEELQSANEELETSKEDVQHSNDALQRANTDLENLLASTEIATLFLDDEYRIRGFTPTIQEIYNVQNSDIGRKLSDFTSKAIRMPEYPALPLKESRTVDESELVLPDGRIFLRRVLPYKTHDNRRDGIVATFIDVTELKRSEDRFLKLANSVPVMTWITSPRGDVEFFNDRWYEYTGQTPNMSEGWGWQSVIHPDDVDSTVATWKKSLETGDDYKVEYRLRRADGAYRWHKGAGSALKDELGEIQNWFGTCVDIHEQKEKVDLLEQSGQSLRTIVEAVPQYIWRATPDGKADYASERFCKFVGYPLAKLLDFQWLDLIHPEDRERVSSEWQKACDNGAPITVKFRIFRGGSPEYRWVRSDGVPYYNSAGNLERYYGTWTDIHEQVLADIVREESDRRLRTTIETSPTFMCLIAGPELVYEQANDGYMKLLGRTESIIGKTVKEVIPEAESQGFITLLNHVRESGKPYVGRDAVLEIQRKPGGPLERRYLDFVYQPDFDSEGSVARIFVHGVDVTEKVEARVAVENEWQNIRSLFKDSPQFVAILGGKDYRFEFVNEAHIQMLGFNATGLVLKEAQPESLEVYPLLDKVYETGETLRFEEIPITLGNKLRYFDVTYAARKNLKGEIDGIMCLGVEATNRVESRSELERTARLIEHTPFPFFAVDRDWKFVYWNPAAEKTLGRTAKELVGQDIWASWPGLDKTVFGSAYKDVAKDRTTRAVDGYFPELKSWFSVTAFPFQDGIAVVFQDVTERKAQEESLAKSRNDMEKLVAELDAKSAQLQTIIEQMPMSVIFAEAPSGRLLFSNRQFEKLWKYKFIPSDDIEGYKEYVGFHPDGRRYEGHEWPLARAITKGEVILAEETDVLLGDGTRAIFSISAAPVKNAKGEVVAAVVISEDVTERKKAEIEIKSAKDAAEIANESKTRFLANMSHEIRTPLSAIVGFSDLLKSHVSHDKDANSFIERISRNAGQLARLIDELLDLSKIEADRLEVEKLPVNLDSIVEDVSATMILRAQDKGLDLNFTWTTPKPEEVVTDPTRLSQIMTNVIGNAVKFTDRGSVNVELGVDQRKLTIRVRDTGIGLSEEQQKRIFEPFMQADPSVTRKFGGTGLGLALSKRLANLLGGDVILEHCAPQEGCVFRIEIEVEPARVKKTANADKSDGSDAQALKGKQILLVDDSPDNRAIVALYLKGVGAEITEAVNGQDGYEKATSRHFDVVLMDIQMPVLDGYQAIVKLRNSGFIKPVIALTAHAFKEERDRCLSLGFSGYVTKPINRANLIKSISNLIG